MIAWALSPDGTRVAGFQMDEQQHRPRVAVVSLRDDARRFLEIPARPGLRLISFTPDGRALAYVDSHERIENVWIEPLEEANDAG